MTAAATSVAVEEQLHSDSDTDTELDELDAEGRSTEALPAETDLSDDQAPSEKDAVTEAAADDRNGKRWVGAERRVRLLIYFLLPALVLLLAVGASYLNWLGGTSRAAQLAGVDARHAAIDSTVAMLSYRPDTVDRDLGAAGDRLTGGFKESYAKLVHDVVIPGSKQQQIAALATVPAAATVSASDSHAVVLVFVDQTITIGHDAPSNTASRVRVNLDHVGGRWLIAGFDPV
jgi:Mce-associated membrane protein